MKRSETNEFYQFRYLDVTISRTKINLAEK